MKRIFIILFICCLLITGCSSTKNIKKNFVNRVDGANSYKLNGTLSINNNDDVYNYSVEVGYKKDDYYKVTLKNKANNHVQIILKTDDGVYVLTPSLNKSFKFQSDWPYNNSQIYLLDAISLDIKNDKDSEISKKDNKYFLMTKVNYSNNSRLIKQKLEFDEEFNLSKVIVYDKDGIEVMTMKFDKIKLNCKFSKEYFDVDSIIDSESTTTESDNKNENNTTKDSNKDNDKNTDNKTSNNTNETNKNTDNKTSNNTNETNKNTINNDRNSNTNNSNNNTSNNNETNNTKTTGRLDDIVYPLFLPSGTKLVDEERVKKDNGERVIMTYEGEKSFLLVEETMDVFNEFTIIPSSGEPFQLMDTLGVMTNNSLSWSSGTTDYYLVSDVMSKDEMIEVAQSIGNVNSLK